MTSRAGDVEQAVAALERGGVAILATDTVYGFVARADNQAAVARIYELKDRPRHVPLALLVADVETLLEALPSVEAGVRRAIASVLPGAYTLVVHAAGSRYESLGSGDPPTLGVRVPVLPPAARAVVSRAGPLASTSANLHGEPDAACLAEIPAALLDSVDAVVDDGVLPGTPSSVIDLSGPQPRVLREGAVAAEAALAAVRDATA